MPDSVVAQRLARDSLTQTQMAQSPMAQSSGSDARRRWWDVIDPRTLLIAYICLLVFVPSSQVVRALGGAGSPAVLFGVLLFVVWVFLKLTKSPLLRHEPGALHIAWFGFALAGVASYVSAMSGPIGILEMNGADRGLVYLASWSGVVLLTADGLLTRAHLDLIVKALAGALAVAAAIALSQYVLGVNWYSQIHFPGLSPSFITGGDERAGFLRITGTSTHAIEYGVVQTMGIALSLHLAAHASSNLLRVTWGSATALIALTLPLTIARSSMVGLVVVSLVLIPTWPRRWKLRALLLSPVALVLARLAFPGVLGTVLSLFTFIAADPSTSGRTQDYAEVARMGMDRPFFGSGLNTLIPKIYFTVDNEYIVNFLTTGLVGTAALLGLFGTAVLVAVRSRRRSSALTSAPTSTSASASASASIDRNLLQSLLAGIAVGIVSWGIFDGFAFQQATGILLLLIGATACMSRLTLLGDTAREPASSSFPRRAAAVSAALGTAVLVAGISAADKPSRYVADTAILFHSSDTTDGLFATFTDPLAYATASWMRSDSARAQVKSRGGTARYEVAQGDGSLATITDVRGSGPLMRIGAVGPTPQSASRTVAIAAEVLREHIREEQRSSGSTHDQLIVGSTVTTNSPVEIASAPSRALVGLCLLSVLSSLFALTLLRLFPIRLPARAIQPEGSLA